jgi:hypothetical protein
VHQGDVFFYVRKVDLIFQRKSTTVWNMREKAIKTDGRKLLLNTFELVGISGRYKSSKTTEAHSNLDLTEVKYRTYKHSSEENLYVMERIRPRSSIHSENKLSTWLCESVTLKQRNNNNSNNNVVAVVVVVVVV